MPAYEVIYGPEPGGPEFTAETFLAYLRRSNPQWWQEANDEDLECPWVFRGHADSKWELIPSALRITRGNRLLQFVKKFKNTPFFEEEKNAKISTNLKLISRIHHAYRILRADFFHIYRELGHDVSSNENYDKSATDTIISITHPAALGIIGSKNGEIDKLMQHYGFPTFLLDWTEDPWTAAFFAANDHKQNNHIAVFALKRDNPFQSILKANPAHNTPLKLQKGIFTHDIGSLKIIHLEKFCRWSINYI